MERKVAETEVIVHRMVEEAERRQHEAETLRKEVRLEVVFSLCDSQALLQVSKARDAEKEAKGKLIEFLNTSMTDVSKSSPTWHGTTALSPNGRQGTGDRGQGTGVGAGGRNTGMSRGKEHGH